MKDLKDKVIILFAAEIILALIFIFTHSNDYILPLFLFTLAANIISVILLLVQKPKHYGYLIAVSFAIILLPIVSIFYSLSDVVC